MRSFLLTTSAILALSTAAYAAADQKPAVDKNAQAVHDDRGNCVRTKWQSGQDACAQAKSHRTIEGMTQEERTVYFAFNKATLTAKDKAKLDSLAEVINESSEVTDVQIHGYTDQIGSAAYNEALATKRAQAVKAYLDSKARLTSEADVRGMGKSAPLAECAAVRKRAGQISCMADERRVEVELKVQR